jgi:hypothetical protein
MQPDDERTSRRKKLAVQVIIRYSSPKVYAAETELSLSISSATQDQAAIG